MALNSGDVAAVKGPTVLGVSMFDEFAGEFDGILCPVTAGVDHLSGWNCWNKELLL